MFRLLHGLLHLCSPFKLDVEISRNLLLCQSFAVILNIVCLAIRIFVGEAPSEFPPTKMVASQLGELPLEEALEIM